MRAAVYYNNNDIRIEEMPKPEIDDGELLVKVMASGICGSDVMEWYRIKTAPRVLGHEIAGIIAESKSRKHKAGERVFVSHHVPCNKCKYCLNNHHTACKTLHTTNYAPGGFSQFIRIPLINAETGVYVLPDNVSFEEGTFVEPVGCVVRGHRIAGVKKGENILIIGSGISGLLHVQLSRLAGASVTATDISDYRLKAAKKLGADNVANANEELKEKFDKVIVCTGAAQAVKTAFFSVDKGGLVLFFAVPKPDISVELPINDFWRNEIRIATSYGAAPADLDEALNLIKSKKLNLKDMITHRLPLEETGKGFKIVAEAKNSIKVVIEPNKSKKNIHNLNL